MTTVPNHTWAVHAVEGLRAELEARRSAAAAAAEQAGEEDDAIAAHVAGQRLELLEELLDAVQPGPLLLRPPGELVADLQAEADRLAGAGPRAHHQAIVLLRTAARVLARQGAALELADIDPDAPQPRHFRVTRPIEAPIAVVSLGLSCMLAALIVAILVLLGGCCSEEGGTDTEPMIDECVIIGGPIVPCTGDACGHCDEPPCVCSITAGEE